MVGLAIVSFGWNFSHAALYIYGGTELSATGFELMRAQSVLLILLALNGVTEAYTFAAMTDIQLHSHSAVLVVFSCIYVLSAAFFSYAFGAIGFVVANCINMGLRIAFGWVFIHRHFLNTPHTPLRSVIISPRILVVFSVAFIMCNISENLIYDKSLLLHIGFGGCVFLVVLYMLRHEYKDVYLAILSRFPILSRFRRNNEAPL